MGTSAESLCVVVDGENTSPGTAIYMGPPRFQVMPTAPFEEEGPTNYGPCHRPTLNVEQNPHDVDVPFVTQATPVTTEAQAILISLPAGANEQDARIVVPAYFQGGFGNDAPPIMGMNSNAYYFDGRYPSVEALRAMQEYHNTNMEMTRGPTGSMRNQPLQLEGNDQTMTLSTSSNPEDKSQMVASGVAGAVVGGLLLGPYLGLVAGFYSAYATQRTGAAKDIAIALGEVAIITRDKARLIDQKHHLVDQSKQILHEAWEYAKKMDRKHHILDKTKDFILFSFREIAAFSYQHRVLERGIAGAGRGIEWLVRKLSAKQPAINYEEIPVLPPAQPY